MSMMRLLTIKDLCTLTGVSRRTIYRIRASGQLPKAIRVGGRARWRPEDIERWIQTSDAGTFSCATAEGLRR